MEDWEIALSLGREELVFLLRVMGLRTIPGLEEEPLSHLSQVQQETAMAVAKHSLLARGIIQHPLGTANEIEIDAVVAGLVSSGLRAQVSITISRTRPNGNTITRYYHLLSSQPYLAVEHGSPDTGVHTFRTIRCPEIILRRLTGLLNLQDQNTPAGRGGILTEESFLRARQAAVEREAPDTVRAILQEGGLDAETAERAATTLCRLLSESSLVRINLETGEEEGLGLLEGPNSLWLLQRVESSPTSVSMSPVSPEGVRSLLQRWVEPKTTEV